MDLQLKSKIALVTGSTAGIGFAIGSGLPGEGATVINGRSKKHVDQAIKTIRQRHPQANLEARAGDLSTTDTVQRVLSWRAQHALTAWKNSWSNRSLPRHQSAFRRNQRSSVACRRRRYPLDHLKKTASDSLAAGTSYGSTAHRRR